MNTKQKKKMWNIPRLLFLLFLFCIFLLYIKFVYLSLSPKINNINMATFAANRNTVKKTLPAKRGAIYDSEGNQLAINVSSYTLIAQLEKSKVYSGDNYVHDVDATANALASILNTDAESLKEKLSSDRYQVEFGNIGRGLTEITKDQIKALNLPGIIFTESQKRFYPNGDFASYTIGYAKDKEITTYDEENNEIITNQIVGEMGIEAEYNDELSGSDGYSEYQVNKYGYKISGTQAKEQEAKNGYDIYLTIDANIQRFTESAIKNIENEYHPEWSSITVMDPKTGDILASSSSPSFDPNIKNITNYENPLVSKIYEPGSVMKIYTYMCALENNVYNGSDTYLSGRYDVGEYTIYDWNNNGWGMVTYDKGFEYSSNVAIANILANNLTKKQLKECFKKYGFGEETGIELSNESSGSFKFNYDVEYYNAGFGQGINTTAIQQLQALTLISNNGKMLKPHIVSKIVDVDKNKTVYKRKVHESEQLIKDDTVNKMKELMYNVIHGTDPGSTGYTYRVDGFDIIGKTGTSQIYNTSTGMYSTGDNDYIFSFAGMYPKDNPEIIIYAAMKRPTWGKSSGLYTNVRNLIQNIAKYKSMFVEVMEKPTSTYTTKSYISKDLESVKQELEQNGIIPIILGNGNKITYQSFSKDIVLAPGEKIILKTNSNDIAMPNMIGWSRSDVDTFCKITDIKCNFEDSGYVINQSISEGTPITKELELLIKLGNKYIKGDEKHE